MKVLFIDDEPLEREKLLNIIPWNQYGFSNFLDTDNGVDALKLIDSETPELVLLDIHLNGMSGMTLIHEIKKNDYPCKIIIISSDTSFSNAKLAVNYGVTAFLNKPVDSEALLEAVIKGVDEINKSKLLSIYYEQSVISARNNILSSILLGSMAYVSEMKYVYQIELDSNYFRLISFILPQKPEDNDVWNEALMYTKNCLSVTFSETALVLIATSPNQEQFLLRQLKNCQENCPQYASLLGIVSPQAGSHTELSTIYAETLRIYQNRYYYKEKQNNILYADSLFFRLDKIKQADNSLIDFVENVIRHIIFLQSYELEKDTLSLLDFLSLRRPPKDSARFILMNYYTQIITTLIEYYPRLEFEIPDKNTLAVQLSKDKYLCDSISYLNDQFQKAIAYIRSESKKNPCQRICQYIDLNYSSPLKLNNLAKLLGYNSAYLGKLFFSETGMNFNTYLDKTRIFKAKEYLEKGVSVIQTSEFSGFSNPDYFTKKFKKYIGILPSEYRAQHLEKCHAQNTPPREINH